MPLAAEAMMDTEKLVPRREAARIAGVHVNTIRLWEQAGRVHPVKAPNKRVLIPLSEVEAIVSDRHPQDEETAREELAACKAENRLLREQLESLRQERDVLLQALIQIRGRTPNGGS